MSVFKIQNDGAILSLSTIFRLDFGTVPTVW
jgi:hypothetical protein